jgi:hypothetical protein
MLTFLLYWKHQRPLVEDIIYRLPTLQFKRLRVDNKLRLAMRMEQLPLMHHLRPNLHTADNIFNQRSLVLPIQQESEHYVPPFFSVIYDHAR